MFIVQMEYQQHSLWNIIVDHVPESELSEVRIIIGEALVDYYTDLCTEVQTWEQILRDSLSTRQGSQPKTVPSPLADPPAIKALLKAEIQLLLLSVRERAARQGRDEESALSRYSPNVVSYALGDGSESPRSSVENKDTPSRLQSRQSQNGSRSSSRLSSVSSLEDEIEAVKTKLNVSRVDEVVSHLQSVLIEDCEALKMKVQSLQECVEQAHYRQADGELREPTVTELREERKIIQMDLEQQAMMSCSASPDKAASLGLQPRSRQRTGCRDLDFGTCRNPAPPPAPAPKILPRPPSSRNLPLSSTPRDQLSALPSHRTPGRPSSPGQSPHLLTGPASSEAPERLRERGCSPGALFRHPRRGGSRLGEASLAPLVSSPSSSPSPELGMGQQHVAVGEQQQGKNVEDAKLVCEKVDQLSLWSGKDLSRLSCRDATTKPVSYSTKVVGSCLTKELSPDPLVPCPPVSQKPANRGQSVARRLGLPQLDKLVSPS